MRIYEYCTNNHPLIMFRLLDALIDEYIEVDLAGKPYCFHARLV